MIGNVFRTNFSGNHSFFPVSVVVNNIFTCYCFLCLFFYLQLTFALHSFFFVFLLRPPVLILQQTSHLKTNNKLYFPCQIKDLQCFSLFVNHLLYLFLYGRLCLSVFFYSIPPYQNWLPRFGAQERRNKFSYLPKKHGKDVCPTRQTTSHTLTSFLKWRVMLTSSVLFGVSLHICHLAFSVLCRWITLRMLSKKTGG